MSGGINPIWRGDGRELYYLTPDRDLMAVAVTPADTFTTVTPVRLFATRAPATAGAPFASVYDVTPDGRRFLMTVLPEHPDRGEIVVAVNWSPSGQRTGR